MTAMDWSQPEPDGRLALEQWHNARQISIRDCIHVPGHQPCAKQALSEQEPARR